MRKGRRMKKQDNMEITDKIIMYAAIGAIILAIIVISLFMYSKSLSEEVRNSTLNLSQLTKTEDTVNTDDTESASTQIGQSVEESENELNTSNMQNNEINDVANQASNELNVNTEVQNQLIEKVEEQPIKELSFKMPVEGEIYREFAKESLIYSQTLKEWTTHMGIDIKADKTTVVNASEEGIIKSIKNDPRYGLTIVIEHENNFQTVYSNLLTSEFVVEGESVNKGQPIGTVGNSAVFEIADEPHLHFEIIKDGLQVDPNLYLNN